MTSSFCLRDGGCSTAVWDADSAIEQSSVGFQRIEEGSIMHLDGQLAAKTQIEAPKS